MPDTLYQKIIVLISKVDSLSVKVDKLSDKSELSLLTPIIAALITAIFGTLIAQAIDRIYKNRRETKKDLREIHSQSVNLKIKLKDLFRQLAMYKFHSQYWWHIHTKESNKDFSSKYYLEHLRSQSETRDTEKEIGEVKANFLAEVVKFEKLKGKKFNVDNEKTEIENLIFPKAKTYSDDISTDKLREELAEVDEKELREKYFSRLQVFQNIIDKMV
ncbi:MAG: hypothetical protein IPQ08_13645 [Chitinophagaceae bacterium]|nr:hypothetical protein [Chitinophagaceae bacterium]